MSKVMQGARNKGQGTPRLQLTAYNLRLITYGLLLVALLLASFLRLWQLDTLPLGLYHDEAYNGLDALALLEGHEFPIFHEGWELYAQDAHADRPPVSTRFPLFFEGNYGREPVHVYLMALSIALLGPTPFALRLVPALAGILGVFTTYLAASALFNEQLTRRNEQKGNPHSPFTIHHSPFTIPLFSAFALAILYPAVHFSRFGLRSMLFVPISTLCIYFFWHGLDTFSQVKSEKLKVKSGASTSHLSLFTSYSHFVIAGFLLGLGLYIYAAGRLFPLLFVGFVLLWFGTHKGALRRFWRPVGLMATISILTALPLLLYFARYPYFFFFRTAYVANKGAGTFEGRPWLTWLANIPRVIGGLFWQGETHFRHNLPGRPFMDGLQSGLFLLGTVAVGRNIWQKGAEDEPVAPWLRTAVFPLLWLAVMLLPTLLSGDAPHFGRMTGAMPVIAIFIGVGADKLHRLLTTRFSLLTSHLLLLTLLTLSTLWTATDYFHRYASHPLMQVDFYQPDWEAGLALAAVGGDALYLSPTQEEIATFLFALGEKRSNMRNINADQSLVALGFADALPVYLVSNETTTAVLSNLQPLYGDQLVLTPFTNHTLIQPTTQPRIPETSPPLNQPANQPITLLAYHLEPRDNQLWVTLTWQSTAVLPANIAHTAFVHLLDQNGEIMTQTDRPPTGFATSDWRPGERIRDTFIILWPENGAEPTAVRTGFYDPATLQPLGDPVLIEAEW